MIFNKKKILLRQTNKRRRREKTLTLKSKMLSLLIHLNLIIFDFSFRSCFGSPGQFCLHIMSVYSFFCQHSRNVVLISIFLWFLFQLMLHWSQDYVWMCVCASVKLWLLLKKKKKMGKSGSRARFFCVGFAYFSNIFGMIRS